MSPGGRPRLLLGLAAVAVAFAAADTYVVVLALPEMVASVGVSAEELQDRKSTRLNSSHPV